MERSKMDVHPLRLKGIASSKNPKKVTTKQSTHPTIQPSTSWIAASFSRVGDVILGKLSPMQMTL